MDLATFSKGTQLTQIGLDDIQEGERYTPEAKQRLRDFKSQALQGDIVYHFRSEPEEWERGMGSEGYIVVRNEQVIAEFVLRMN